MVAEAAIDRTPAAARDQQTTERQRHALANAPTESGFLAHPATFARLMWMPQVSGPDICSLLVIRRRLGLADFAIASRYLRGIDSAGIIQAVEDEPEPMIRARRRLAPPALTSNRSPPNRPAKGGPRYPRLG
jgi:hypothetical protein